jgi:NitT/TauT family transport system substrate-binding protein
MCKIISDTRTLKGTHDVFGGLMPAACLYAHVDFVQKNPNTCQALANAIVHGLKWLQTAGPSDIIKTVPETYLLGDRALYLASFNKVREAIALDGLLPEEGAQDRAQGHGQLRP